MIFNLSAGFRSQISAFLLIGLQLVSADAEDTTASNSGLSGQQATEIRSRIDNLHAQHAEYHRKLAAGETTPNADLREQWPQIIEKVGALHGMIDTLNAVEADSPERPAIEKKLLGTLQQIGLYLHGASHPKFTPRILDADQVAEMKRCENAIADMKFGDRASATPVKVLTPDPCFTLIHLPVPIELHCQPDEIVYLAATTGGAFHNGLSMIELQADERGHAKTTWVSIGDAIADCSITVYSLAAIEPQEICIKVVSPSLVIPENFPAPEQLNSEIPRLKSKLTTAKSRTKQITE